MTKQSSIRLIHLYSEWGKEQQGLALSSKDLESSNMERSAKGQQVVTRSKFEFLKFFGESIGDQIFQF